MLKNPLRAKLFEASRQSAIIQKAIDNWQHGRCNWEEALETAILALHEENRILEKITAGRISDYPKTKE